MKQWRYICVGIILASLTGTAWGQKLFFDATGQLTPSPHRLDSRLSITLNASQAVHDAEIFAHAQAGRAPIGQVEYWRPGQQHDFNFELPSPHTAPGEYQLLIEIAFKDASGANLGVAMALDYPVGDVPDTQAPQPPADARVIISGDRLDWRLGDVDPASVRLTMTGAPAWVMPAAIDASADRFELRRLTERPPIPNWQYTQMARLEWIAGGRHFSRIQNWEMFTDDSATWSRGSRPPPRPAWRNPAWMWAVAVLIVVCCGLLGWLPGERFARWFAQRWPEGLLGASALLALTLWALAHTSPALWLTRTWATGGDVASQVFYASVFMDWLPHGKISGWLPESFAGFPAFTFYFPFPFTLAGLLQFPVGQQVAFKLVNMLPVFLLLPATYLLGAAWGWRPASRLLGAAGAAGFILADRTSYWGGNILAALSGEFAYAWGLFFAVLFWGALALTLRRGGKWWLLAGLLEALVALSHGYALLMAGFGAFVFLLDSARFRRDLRWILQVHLLAFLLIGFWMIPLLENLPWTIPNDTPTPLGHWRTAWPEALWPLALGFLPLAWITFRAPGSMPRGIFVLLGLVLLAVFGFNIGGRLGLADLRFFPYAQWALGVTAGAAAGWALYRWLPSLALPLAVALVFALGAWWAPRLDQIENWSRWNLSGYEPKPLFSSFQATARDNAGELSGPRLVFEHDPDNADLGSTRAMEALPMFGSRPALEGLYMESAMTGPFIYQLQAEVSQRPSSPLSRFPSTARSVEDAVGHMNELYVDRLVLRSAEKKALFDSDPRFRRVSEHGPLATYEFTELNTELVEVVAQELQEQPREGWLRHAFQRFVLDFPYRERTVYLAPGEQLPDVVSITEPSAARIRSFSRERLVFETDHPGKPHLVRMTFHPRWRSTGGETLFLAEPSFMLIFPAGNTVELEYAWSWGNYLGIGFSVLGLLMLGAGLVWRTVPARPDEMAGVSLPRAGLLVLGGAATLVILAAWWTNPERAYQWGHEQLGETQWVAAAEQFDRAFRGRHTPARQSEALFWAARSLDLGGEKAKALVRYARLREEYPESYWYPESVFRLIEIHLSAGERVQADTLFVELSSAVPNNPWTGRARGLLQNPEEVR